VVVAVGRVGLWGLVGAAGGIWVLGGIGVEAVVVVGCAVVVKGPGIGRGELLYTDSFELLHRKRDGSFIV
jgi:hypothetical protein